MQFAFQLISVITFGICALLLCARLAFELYFWFKRKRQCNY